MSFRKVHGDDNAFSGGKTVCLDDNRGTLFIDVLVRGSQIGEGLVFRGRNPMPFHKGFGKIL